MQVSYHDARLVSKVINNLYDKNLNKINSLVIIFKRTRDIYRNDPKYTDYIFQDCRKI